MSEESQVVPVPSAKNRAVFAIVTGSVFVFFAVLMLSVVFGLVIAFRQPRMCEGAVRILARQELLTEASAQPAPGFDAHQSFIQTQFEIIQSQDILMPVIERLKLIDRWGNADQELSQVSAYQKLRSRLVVHRYRDTILIEIVVRDFDSAAAAEMANAIAESYQANRLAVARTIHGSDKLREEMEVRSREPVEIVDRTVRTGPSCTTRAGFLCLPDELMAGLMRGALIGLPLAFVFSLLTAFGFSRK